MFIWAHRGYHKYHPENSLASFNATLGHHFHGIEFDVRMTKCQTLVLYHDATLERQYGIAKAISALTYDEIQEYLEPHGLSMTKFEEVLPFFQKNNHLWLNIEIKPLQHKSTTKDIQKFVQKIADMIAPFKNDLMDRTIFSSFCFDILEALHALDPSFKLGFLSQGLTSRQIQQINMMNFYSVHLCHNYLLHPKNLWYYWRLRSGFNRTFNRKKIYFFTIRRRTHAFISRLLKADGVFSDILIEKS